MSVNRKSSRAAGAAALALVLITPALRAQSVPAAATAAVDAVAAATPASVVASSADSALQEVVITGTRTAGLEAAESPAPLQIVTTQTLETVASSPDLLSTLGQVVPSLQVQALGGDMSNNTLMANLDGLSPNDVLVLVDGKRRHTTANLAVDGESEFQGAASADLNFIPVDAIDHIEVLTDGAAAQYGSDAVAGVINVILKKNSSGGLLSATDGRYFDGGGVTGDASANWGFAPFDDAFLNVTAEVHNHGHSDQGAPDERVINPANLATYPNSNLPEVAGYPHLNEIIGDGEYHLKLVSFNSGYDFDGGTEFYLFSTYGSKDAASYENYRLPNKVSYVDPTTGATVYPLPFGFDPQEAIHELDYQVTGGFKGAVEGWRWDVATAYGADHVDQYTLDSANAGLSEANAAPTPSDYYDGLEQATQWTTTLDVNRDFDVGLGSPLNFAFGGEYRRETYTIGAGIPASYLDGGAQSFPGFTPTDAGVHARENESEYVDFDLKPIDPLRLDLAARHEHYSDFGNANVGKLTARYDFGAQYALRATIQNGFRAPTLAEEYYSSTNVSPTTAFVQLPPDSVGGKLLGLGNGLQPEKSTNYSVGFVFRPTPRLNMTLDLYEITINNRIVGSGTILGSVDGQVFSQNVLNAIEANGNQLDPQVVANGLTGINVFTNGIDTRTQGADFTLDFPTSHPFGNLTYTIGATYNATAYTYVRPPPAQLGNQPLFDLTALSDLTTISPRFKGIFGVFYSYERFSANLQEIIYGPSSQWQNDDGDNGAPGPITNCSSGVPSLAVCNGSLEYYNNRIGTTPITNLSLNLNLLEHLQLTVGANNLLNRFPPTLNPTLLQHEDAFAYGDTGVDSTALFSPYGINGGYYYVKATLRY